LGGRLRYVDAIALYEAMAVDTASYTGMAGMHMVVPMDATAIISALQAGGHAMLGDLSPARTGGNFGHADVTDEERREAEASMSSLFGSKHD